MARHRNGTAAVVWRQRLQRFESSGLSVRAFCAREGVSQASFYQWRRRLGGTEGNGSPSQPAFQEIRVTPVVGVLSIALPGGVRLELPADHVELARAVVRELALASRDYDMGGA